MRRESRDGRLEGVLCLDCLCHVSRFQISTRPRSTAAARSEPIRGGQRPLRSPATLRMSHSTLSTSVVALNSLVRIVAGDSMGPRQKRLSQLGFSCIPSLRPVLFFFFHLNDQDQQTFSLLSPPVFILFLSLPLPPLLPLSLSETSSYHNSPSWPETSYVTQTTNSCFFCLVLCAV